VTITATLDDASATADSTYVFDIPITTTCYKNVIAMTAPIGDKLYYIGDGNFDMQAMLSQQEPNCQIDYTLTETGYTAGTYDTNVITFVQDGSPDWREHTITINTSNLGTYDKTSKVLTLTMTLPENAGQTPIVNTFTVYLQDECWSNVLTKPSIPSTLTVPLWSTEERNLGAAVATNSTKDCGATTYTLKDEGGTTVSDPFTIT